MFFFTPTAVNILALKINAIDNASVVNAGALQITDKLVSYKRNSGVAELNGDLSPLSVPISTIVDPDVVDSTTAKNSVV